MADLSPSNERCSSEQVLSTPDSRWITLQEFEEEFIFGHCVCAYSPPKGEYKGLVCGVLTEGIPGVSCRCKLHEGLKGKLRK